MRYFLGHRFTGYGTMRKIVLGLQSMAMQRGYNDDVYPMAETVRIIEETTGATCVPLGGGNAHHAPGFIQKPDFDSLVAEIRSADLVIGVDSGILAIALAMEVPCLAIFGPTSEKHIVWQFSRYVDTSKVRVLRSDKKDTQCKRPCSFQTERGWIVEGKCVDMNHIPDCMREITPLQVAEAAKEMLETKILSLHVLETQP